MWTIEKCAHAARNVLLSLTLLGAGTAALRRVVITSPRCPLLGTGAPVSAGPLRRQGRAGHVLCELRDGLDHHHTQPRCPLPRRDRRPDRPPPRSVALGMRRRSVRRAYGTPSRSGAWREVFCLGAAQLVVGYLTSAEVRAAGLRAGQPGRTRCLGDHDQPALHHPGRAAPRRQCGRLRRGEWPATRC
jgi:hypothetical protein